MRLITDSERTADPEACPDCGLAYVHDSPSDQQIHAEIHEEMVNGPLAPLVDAKRVISKYAEFEILLAEKGVSRAEEELLERAASNANCETHYDFGLFHAGDIEEAGTRVVWARVADRIAGLLLVDVAIRGAFRVPLDRLKNELNGQPAPALQHHVDEVRAGIAYVWVLRKYRTRGLARTLIKTTFGLFDGSWDDMAFQKPLTTAAARLIYRLASSDGRSELLVY
jgi:acetyltransferase ESCO-like protein